MPSDVIVPPTDQPTGTGGGRRAVITLGPAAADTARAMARDLGVAVPEVVRRGLSLMRLWMTLGPGEALLIRRADGSLDRLVLWPDEEAIRDRP